MDPIYELLLYSCILLFLVIIYNWIYGQEPKTIKIDENSIKTLKGDI
jgi:hypothetical protein